MLLISQSVLWLALQTMCGSRLTFDEYYSLSLASWILPLLLASVLWFAFGAVPAVILLVIMVLALLFITKREAASSSKSVFLLLPVLFGLFVLLRLAFVSKAIIPLYFDSAQHYLTIKNLLGGFDAAATSSAWPTPSYYHIGFHLLAGWITSVLRADIIPIMLIVGQMIVVTIPFSVFFVAKHETQSNSAGLFAMLLAGFGWYMPAYTVNWGKYPALTSLPLIAFALSLGYLFFRYKSVLSPGRSAGLFTLLFASVIVTGFVHSRSLIVFGIVLLTWLLLLGWHRLPRLLRVILFSAVLLGILLEINVIQTKDVLGPLFDPYWDRGVFITSVVLFLSIFAQRAYPRLTFASILAVFFLLGAMFIPITVPGYGDLTLLDRPFVEMILYLPLSFLGGLGLAGLEQALQPLSAKWQVVRWGMGGVFLGLLVVNALLNYTLYPSDCCNIVSRDDLVAIDWVNEHLPSEARILISSTELRVLASDSFQGSVNGDAGAWITPLTDRATVPLPYHTDFSQHTVLNTVCQLQADYIYIGGNGTAFNNDQIEPFPNWYKILLSMPETKVYQVIGCE